MIFKSSNEEETKELGRKIANKLKKGDIIVLSGELGSGKTKFTEGFLRHFGLENEVSSPTFTIVNEYIGKDMDIFHFDLYRLKNIFEFESIGGEEYFERGISIIEWGEMIEEILPNSYIKISFSKSNDDDNIRLLDMALIGNIELDLKELQ